MSRPFESSTRRPEPSLNAPPSSFVDPPTNSTSPPASTDNPSAFAHNATFPPAVSIAEHLRNVPDFIIRKPSAGGLLHLQTDVHESVKNTPHAETDVGSRDFQDFQASQEQKWNSAGPHVVSRRSWEGGGGSPSSTKSTASLGPLGDVTPLPSPVAPSFPSDIWRKLDGRRSHSNSNASIDKSMGLLSPVLATSPPKRKKAYGDLTSSPPSQSDETNGTPDRNRALSDFVPEPLMNVRPRVATGPLSISLPLPSVANPPDQKSPLHREKFLAKARPSVDVSKTFDLASLLPSPPASTHTPSEEEADSNISFLTIKDTPSHQVTHWKTIRQLGTGSFSEVMLATPASRASSVESLVSKAICDKNSLVAIKIVSHNPPGDENEQRMDTSIQREIELLQTVSHPSLPQLYASENTETQALLVLNYCPGGDLFDLASQQRQHVTPSLIQRIFAELVDATLYLHNLLIVHRDIKLENVLVNIPLASLPAEPTKHPHPIVTLTDLGLSKHIPPPPESPLLTHACGSVDYAAPELLLGQAYDGRATDAWALGVLLYSLMEGRLPFDPVPNSKRRGQNNVKHRIARCDWLWCEYGDEFGDWRENALHASEMRGAREVVEGLLKKVSRGRWPLEKVKGFEWVKNGLQVEGGLRLEM